MFTSDGHIIGIVNVLGKGATRTILRKQGLCFHVSVIGETSERCFVSTDIQEYTISYVVHILYICKCKSNPKGEK